MRRERSPGAPRRLAAGGDGDAALDDLLLQRLDALARRVGDERAIPVIVDVPDTAFLQPVRVDATLEGPVLHPLDRVEGDRVDTLDHRREDAARCFVGLIGIDADRELSTLARGLKDAKTGGA